MVIGPKYPCIVDNLWIKRVSPAFARETPKEWNQTVVFRRKYSVVGRRSPYQAVAGVPATGVTLTVASEMPLPRRLFQRASRMPTPLSVQEKL